MQVGLASSMPQTGPPEPSMNANCFCVVIGCMLVASYGCPCGSSSERGNRDPPSTAERLDAIKLDILGQLGMNREPDAGTFRANSTVEETRKVIRMYRKSLQQLSGVSHTIVEDVNQKAKQFYSYTPSPETQVPANFKSRKGGLHLFFNVNIPEPTNPNKETQVTKSTLRLHIRRFKSTARRSENYDQAFKVKVFMIVARSTPKGRKFEQRLIDSKTISRRHFAGGTWIQFNVGTAVQEWIQNPSSNFGFLVTTGNGRRLVDTVEFSRSPDAVEYNVMTPRSRKRLRVTTPSQQNTPDVIPQARKNATKSTTSSVAPRRKVPRYESTTMRTEGTTFETTESSSSTPVDNSPTLSVFTRRRDILARPRRDVEPLDCQRGDGETRCCRYPLWVSFDEIGWGSFIIEPRGYQAYFCDGACPHRYKVAHHHSGIQSIVNGLDSSRAPAPCCSPSKLSEMPLVHYNSEGNAVISVFQDIIVDECKCS